MTGTINYNRDKNPKINDTGIDVTPLVGEEPTAAAGMAGDNSGTTGILNIEFQGDADPAGGTVLENLFRVEDLQVTVDINTGVMRLTASIVPVLGDGTDAATPTAIAVTHPQGMDTWQAAAGVAQSV